jgi:hypothetical protein
MNEPDERVTSCFKRMKSADLRYALALEVASPDTVYQAMYEVCLERFDV